MAKNSVAFDERIHFDASGLTGAYQTFTSAGFYLPIASMQLVNSSTADVDISFDGSTDHYFLRSSEKLDLDFQKNANPNSFYCNIKLGQQVYVKAGHGVKLPFGLIYLSAFGQGN